MATKRERYKGTAFESEEEFLAYCRSCVEAGECDLSAGELEVLLEIIDERKEKTK